MVKPKDPKDSLSDLRKKATKALSTQMKRLQALSTRDVHELVQELGTHQIELEMQNEELRRAQDALEESRGRYADLYDFAPIGYFTFDRNNLITDVNLAGAILLGITKQQLLGKPILSFFPPPDRAAFTDHLAAVFSSEARQTAELGLRTRKGSMLRVRLESIRGEAGDGGVSFCRTAMSDVTDRHRAEEALRKSENQFRLIAERSSEIIFQLDLQGRLTYVSPAIREYGFDPAQALQQHFSSFVLPEDRQLTAQAFSQVSSGKKLDSLAIRLLKADGSSYFSEINVVPIHDNGTITGIQGISRDITERKQAEAALQESEQKLRLFIEHSPAAIAMVDRDMKYLAASRRWYADYHVEDRDIIGRSHYSIFPDTPEYWKDVYRSCLAGAIERKDADPWTRPDGSTDWIRWEIRPWRTSADEIGGLIIFSENITTLKKTELALQTLNNELEQRVAGRTRELQVATETVKTERQRLFSVLETLPVYVILLDKDHRIPFANRFFRERFGESNGRRCHDYLFDRPESCKPYRVQDTGGHHHWYWTGPDNRDYHIYDFPFADTDGSNLILEMGIDITDQKRAQQALQETISELEEATSRAQVTSELLSLITRKTTRKEYLDATCGLLHAWTGLRHVGIRVTGGNHRAPFEACRGYEAAFLEQESELSLTDDQCICTRVIAGTPDPADRKGMTAKGSFYSGDTHAFVNDLTESERALYRGTCIKFQYRSLAVIPIRYRESTVGSLHLADERQDMLSPTAVEFLEQLAQIIGESVFRFGVEEERTRLASAVESTADGVVITNPESGRIEYVNRAFEHITGYTKEEAVGNTLRLLDSDKDNEAFFKKLRSELPRDGVWRGRLINRKKDGTLYFEDCTFSPVLDQAGNVINYVSIKRDVSEKLQMETVAESVSAMDNIGTIFAGVRHEIGNPINNAKMMLTVLQQKLDTLDSERVRYYVDRSLVEILRVEHLLATLRSFNLFEATTITDLQTGPLLDLFLDLVSENLKQRGVAISLRIRPGAETVRADSRALQHVLLNLVTNAADSLKDRRDPRIDITVSRERDRVLFRVSDNGGGMTDGQLAKLFKPFHTTKANGTGLGLVIVKKMLTVMNGNIDVTSRVGEGTIVNVDLPVGNNVGQSSAPSADRTKDY